MSNSLFYYVTYIATTPEKLWEALTNGEMTQKYFFSRKVQSNWQKGSPVAYYRPDGQLDIQGKVLVCTPLSLLSFTWEFPADDTQRERSTRVSFMLKQMDSTTVKLTLKHEDLLPVDFCDDDYTFAGLNNGWPAILSNLKSMLETGRTLPPIVG